MRWLPVLRVLAVVVLFCAFARAQEGVSVEEARALGVQSVQHEFLYLGSERKYTCMYKVTVRTYRADNYSRDPITYGADLFSSNMGLVESDLRPNAGPAKVPKAHQFRVVFPTDVLLSVLQHSLLENLQTSTSTSQDEGTKRTLLRFTFRGDPLYTPVGYSEHVAHVLSGRMVLDVTDGLLVLVNGVAAEDAVDGNRLLVPKGIPILDFHAELFQGMMLPLRFSAASFVLVPMGPRAQQRWTEHLTRSFGDRQSCEEFHVHSTIKGAVAEEK